MAVNLVHQFGRERARELLESSFAQFQADKAVVGLARQLRKSEDALAGYAEAAACDRGDFMEYAGLRRASRETESRAGPGPSGRPAQRGDRLAGGAAARRRHRGARPAGSPGLAVVIDPGDRRTATGPRPYVLTADRQARRLEPGRLPDAGGVARPDPDPEDLQRPQPAVPARPRRDAARPHPRACAAAAPGDGRDGAAARARARLDGRRIDAAAPASCATTPATAAPTARTTPAGPSAGSSWTGTPATLRRRIEQRTNTIARKFDRVCEVLGALGYLDGDDRSPPRGPDADADLHRAGPGHRRGAARRAVGRPRRRPSSPRCCPRSCSSPAGPTTRPRRACPARTRARRARRDDVRCGPTWTRSSATTTLDQLREPDLGFCWAAYRWARGRRARRRARGRRPGRRRLRPLDEAAARPGRPGRRRRRRRPLRDTAREAVDLVRRGVVAYSSMGE